MKYYGYPAGTKCIVTWAVPECLGHIGEIVTVTDRVEVFHNSMNNPNWNTMKNMVCQFCIPDNESYQLRRGLHAIDWMRPLPKERLDNADEEQTTRPTVNEVERVC
jgi:hypothetical protein